jgi:hypothetical protein
MKKLLFLLAIIAVGCTPYRYLEKHKGEICTECMQKYAKDSVSVKVDTIYIQKAEQVSDFWQQLYLNCDSLGNVNINGMGAIIDSLKKSRVKPIYIIKNNVLTVNYKVYQDSIRMLQKTIKDIKLATPPPTTKDTSPWLYVSATLLLLLLLLFFFKR